MSHIDYEAIRKNIKSRFKQLAGKGKLLGKRLTKSDLKSYFMKMPLNNEIDILWNDYTTNQKGHRKITNENIIDAAIDIVNKYEQKEKDIKHEAKHKQAERDREVLKNVKDKHKKEVDNLQKQINDLNDDVDEFIEQRERYKQQLREHKHELKKQVRNNEITRAEYNERINELEEDKNKIQKETEEKENEFIDKINKAKQGQKEEDNKILNDMIAKIKHKYKDNNIDEVNKPVINTSNNSPSIKQFLKNTYRDGWYKLTKDEVLNRLHDKKYKQILKDVDKNKLVNDIYLFSSIEAGKEANNIVKSIQLGAINPQDMSNLSEETQQLVNDTLIKKQTIDNLNKRLKYKLPINKPKFERAMLQNRINPLVFRGAYSTNERGR